MSDYVLEGPKWASPVITWSFADTGAADSGGFTSAIGAQYQSVIESAMARWEAVANVTFQQVADGTPGTDLLLGWGSLTAPQAGETDYSYSNGSTQHFLAGMTIRMEDPSLMSLSGGSNPTYQGQQTTLYQLTLHELGHALGLGLFNDPNAVMNLYLSASNPDLDATDIAAVQSLYGAATPAFGMVDNTTGVSSALQGTACAGQVGSLQQEYIYSGADDVAISSAAPNVFIHSGSGNDALAVSSGDNVLDGGQGSNFLVGGTGHDTFFTDASGGGVTWDTLVNFHAGDAVTIWGFAAGAKYWWDGVAGADGHTGATLRASINGGAVTTSVTFAGMSVADASKLAFSTGTQGAGPYLYITQVA